MSRPANLCIYCGQPGITKEHIRGAWSRKLALGNVKTSNHKLTRYDDGIISTFDGALKRPGNTRSLTLKIACKSCNNGWMKDLVDAAIPVIGPMSLGYWGLLGLDSQKLIASWATMFAMSFEFADKATVCVPSVERKRFSLLRAPTPFWTIAIGHGEPNFGSDTTTHRALVLPFEAETPFNKHVQVTVSYFGKLLFLAYYSEIGATFDVNDFCIKEGLQLIWPPVKDTVRKTFRTHGRESVDSLIDRFTEATTDGLNEWARGS